MKRVKYLAGAVGVAVPVLGFTGVAHAASSSASPGAHNGNCRGNVTFKVPQNGNVKGRGWYRSDVLNDDVFYCVGTVDVSLYFNKGSVDNPFCKLASVDIRHSPTGQALWYGNHQVCGDDTHTFAYGFPVQTSWLVSTLGRGYPLSVCAKSQYHGAYTCDRIH